MYKNILKKLDKNTVLVGVAVLAIIVTGVLIYGNSNKGFTLPTIFGQSNSQLGKKAVDYINNNQLSSTPATLVSVSEASGLVKVTIKIGTSQFDSYVTRDGKFLFPQAFDMSTAKKTAAATTGSNNNTPAQTQVQSADSIAKTSSPLLEAYVVSSCPFGLQMQRAIADAVKTAPAIAANVKVRYIGSVENGKITSMHDAQAGGGEAQENLRQICLREEQPAKYWNYVSCYMQKATGTLPNGMPLGDSSSCQASTGVDIGKLNACVSDPSRGIAYAQKDFDLDTKYAIQGSPTLVLDGQQISENGFGGRSSDAVKTIVCDAFSTQPSFCSQTLNKAQAATSFSLAYADATGGSAANNNCAPAQ